MSHRVTGPVGGGTPVSRLSVGIVLYHPQAELLQATVASLVEAARRAVVVPSLFLIDNGGGDAALAALDIPAEWPCRIYQGHGNPGFGAGHNLCLEYVGDIHLVLNPDVEMAVDALAEALAFLDAHPECGLLAPAARWGDGRVQYLCKRPPAVWDLFLRGFAPGWLKRICEGRLARYEMRDLIGEQVVWNPPIASGCCMFVRGEVLRRIGGFDRRYFLYFEDFDLCLRLSKLMKIAYVPAVRIVHHGGHAARKGRHHIQLFVRSAWLFFQLHGWRWI